MTRGEAVCRFIEKYCLVPEGSRVGQPLELMEFQRKFILSIYDNPARTSRAYLSIARKNGKSTLIAAIALAHIVGPEAKRNSQIISGARSRDQAALVYKLAEKMVRLNPELNKIVKPIPSQKTLIGLPMNVEYRAISAEAGTAHGLSPVVAILDEVGQVKGPYDPFVEAIETAQGAHECPVLLAISTQAPTDADLFSVWLDDAEQSKNPRIVSLVYAAPEDCDLMDQSAWRAANPALDKFRSIDDITEFSDRAVRIPASENSFRWLYLNQRIDATSPAISKNVWQACGDPVVDSFEGLPVYGGLDLSETADLTALVLIAPSDGKWHVKPTFWLPEDGLRERARQDRVEYDVWHRQGFLETTPGRAIQYEWVAEHLRGLFDRLDIRQLAFDRYNFRHLKPWLEKAGFDEFELERFVEFGMGFASVSPAFRDLESDLLSGKVAHGGHPVLQMCAANAVITRNPAGDRKLDKSKGRGRIDGIVALTMARGVAATEDLAEEYVIGRVVAL